MEFLDILLWASLLIIVAGAVLPKKYGYRTAAVGWLAFGLRWGLATPDFYLVEHNLMYTVACILAIPATAYLALLMLREERESLMVLTRAAALSAIFYFPFAYLPWLGDLLIGATTAITLASVNALGNHATADGSIITLNGQLVEIILACTAIQSMALFIGLVGCIRAPAARLFKAFLVSVPVIYVLNIVRNTFVIAAFGNQWFQIAPDLIAGWTGEPPSYASFFWAHNVLAEAGSLVALVIISYAVISILPEALDYIRDIFSLVKAENIRKALRGEPVPVAGPLQKK